MAADVVERLRSAGIELAPDEIPTGADLIVAIVPRLEADTTWRIRELSAGCDRLLAVTLGDASSTRGGVTLLESGAADVVPWTGNATVDDISARLERWRAIDRLVEAPVVRDNLVGTGRAWRRLLGHVIEIARFTSSSLLLAGESGTGKELVARLVHTLDPRPDKTEMIIVDCTTIVPTLAGSELFGHERGAFTGATGPRDGAIALAHGGTLFLDEVGDLPLPLQAQLLRVIQERTYKRVGGNDWQRAEFRLVCASHRDLAAAVRRGEFRHDLYHRIATWTFRLPSLAERRDDIPALVRHFLDQARGDAPAVQLDPAVEAYLVERAYPGNVRELRHTVQRLVDRRTGPGRITLGQIPEDERAALLDGAPVWPDDRFESAIERAVASGVGLKNLRKTAEDLAVRIALALESGSVAAASRRLGVTERALQMRQAARREQSTGDDSN
ncbi:MAG TPA: sigma 54-interacting transcriptional regulator [Kofleriaceae bacterium]|nr:sigma 54-interacting transcriptional regulator [Kofleriaceae bacterium]